MELLLFSPERKQLQGRNLVCSVAYGLINLRGRVNFTEQMATCALLINGGTGAGSAPRSIFARRRRMPEAGKLCRSARQHLWKIYGYPGEIPMAILDKRQDYEWSKIFESYLAEGSCLHQTTGSTAHGSTRQKENPDLLGQKAEVRKSKMIPARERHRRRCRKPSCSSQARGSPRCCFTCEW